MKGPAGSGWERGWFVPGGLALALGAPLVANGPASSAGIVLVGLLSAGVLIAARVTRPLDVQSGRSLLAASLAMTVAALALGVATLGAVSPAAAFAGATGQRLGLALWIAAAAWLAAGITLTDKRTLRRSLTVISVASAGYATAALIERVSPSVREWGPAAGLLENSLTLGQTLVLGAAVSLALALSGGSPLRRFTAWTCLGLTLAGLTVTESSAALVGLIVAAAFAVISPLVGESAARRRALSAALPISGAVLSAALVFVAGGALGANAFDLVNRLGNERLVIWRAAGVALRENLIVGRGLEHFTAVLTYRFTESGSMAYVSALDPHNVLLALAMGGGIVTAIPALVSVGALLSAALDRLPLLGSPRFLMVALGGCVGAMGAALFAWPAPAAVIAGAYVLGSVIGLSQGGAAPRPRREAASWSAERIAAAMVAVSAIVAGLVFTLPFSADVRFASTPTERRFDPDTLSAITALWPSPTLEAREYQVRTVDRPDIPAPPDLELRVREYASFHVDAAGGLTAADVTALQAGDASAWTRSMDSAELGRRADGATAMWDYWLATTAAQAGREDEAAPLARAAIEKGTAFPGQADEMRALVDE